MTGTGRKLILVLVLAALMCGLSLMMSLFVLNRDDFGWLFLALTGLQGLALLLLWYVVDRLRIHFQNLERLQGAVLTLAGSQAVTDLPEVVVEGELELGRLAKAISTLTRRRQRQQLSSADRMERILATRNEAIVVITEQGQVSLVNHAAKALLGGEQVRLGTSVFAALERKTLLQAIAKAHQAERPIKVNLHSVDAEVLSAQVASLGQGEGGVLSFEDRRIEYTAAVEHDLALHDRPPPSPPAGDATLLDALPALVLDCETTGLDVQLDRIVSIGAVRLYGGRTYPGISFDRLVNPGIAIPSVSQAIHGISDDMVCGLPGFAEVYGELQPLLTNCVVIGHNVSFDLAMLRREFELAGLTWEQPLFLDSLLLASTLDPVSTSLELEALAAEYGVDVHGRHTALGDSLVTAEIYCRMLPRLADRGIRTLGEAIAFSSNATQLIAKQKAAGW
ncbi:3'-5' exonuclease [Pelagibius sp. Alg239-R121]|uniref:3'-5' exonuclease n=1 Tax=Pelagibius sp. Alg239-R121 TaxID=2993448 RepID=UPI0024A72013|nr:3'-5' exonuclease [Pelagibius sp. Alg239-R121]